MSVAARGHDHDLPGRYLADLQVYSAWADSWAELAAGDPWSPWPRAGHGAAWDPISRSLLVFGGIQNRSDELSYDHRLYNLSLVTASWTELQVDPEAGLASPTGRSDCTVAWDAEARGLFVFGGFDSSYLDQTWRYVVSQTRPPPLIRCQLGQVCLLDSPVLPDNFSNPIMVKQMCSDAEGLHAHGLEESRLLPEPGIYRICRCSQLQNCNQPVDFDDALGFVLVEGPYSNQSAQCFVGSTCMVPAWKGLGITADDSFIVRRSCATGEALAAYGDVSVQARFNESESSFILDWGRLDPAGPPLLAELCWCPSGRSCTSVEAHAATALQLRILCPPGHYELDAACEVCPEDRYCSGGQALQSCPVASTAPAGSSPLLRDFSREQRASRAWAEGCRVLVTEAKVRRLIASACLGAIGVVAFA